jgi:Gem-associated protein 7 (Gemin7)
MSDASDILRKQSLQFWLNVAQKQPYMEADLYQGAQVKGTLVSTDAECNRFRVDNLQTVMGEHKHAVLRGTDVNKMVFDWPKNR